MNKINARSCIIKDVSLDLYKSFCTENHRQGYARAELVIGLYYNEDLVQVMSFGKPRFNKNYQWEIIRDCTKNGCYVRGGVSKLWKYFLEKNNVSSCICYSYPHSDNLYTSKYVDYLGFKNKSKAKYAKNVFFEGEWNGEHKRYSKSILERHGVDRLLKGNFGHDLTNEEILFKLGFRKVIEDGLSPQVDIYFPFGIVYKVTDVDTGEFYIGQTLSKLKWDNGYIGSGTLWQRHVNKYKYHTYKREILYSAKEPLDMYKREQEEIKKFTKINKDGLEVIDHSTGCMNIDTKMHGMNAIVCVECGGINGMHKKSCSKVNRCQECGGINNNHKRTCSNAIICPECGGLNNVHRRGCPKSSVCPECGGSCGQHKAGCSRGVICKECGGSSGAHRAGCSHYNHKPCPECGSTGGHKKTCSNYKQQEPCKECGATYGHKYWCSKYRFNGVCEECGGVEHHKDTCSHRIKPCPECGGRMGKHKSFCSKYEAKKCPECGGINGQHKKECSKYKANRKTCPECGSSGNHKKWCSHYYIKRCEICGGIYGNHKKDCAHYKQRKQCQECGSVGSSHKKSCSHYKPKKQCPECGSMSRHKPGCSIGDKLRKDRNK